MYIMGLIDQTEGLNKEEKEKNRDEKSGFKGVYSRITAVGREQQRATR